MNDMKFSKLKDIDTEIKKMESDKSKLLDSINYVVNVYNTRYYNNYNSTTAGCLYNNMDDMYIVNKYDEYSSRYSLIYSDDFHKILKFILDTNLAIEYISSNQNIDFEWDSSEKSLDILRLLKANIDNIDDDMFIKFSDLYFSRNFDLIEQLIKCI